MFLRLVCPIINLGAYKPNDIKTVTVKSNRRMEES